MPYEDRAIKCIDCGADFPFTAADQQANAERGFTHEPKRCPSCRETHKAQYLPGNRGRRGGGEGGGGGGGGRGGRGGGGGRSRPMFPATCAACGKATEVPFKPTGERPVYCRECFQQQRP